jgi:hypothetical protein
MHAQNPVDFEGLSRSHFTSPQEFHNFSLKLADLPVLTQKFQKNHA